MIEPIAERSLAGHGGRATIVMHAIPFPPVHGGMLDSWNVLLALRQAGLELQVVYWTGPGESGSDVSARTLDDMGISRVSLPRRTGAWRALALRTPPWMTAHTVSSADRRGVLGSVRAFGPDWILSDTWIPFLTARWIAGAMSRPLVYRSQNVESEYWRAIASRTPGVSGLKLRVNASRLRGAEMRARLEADLVVDIASEDGAYWDDLGAKGNAVVLPPLWLRSTPEVAAGERDIDVLFVGNLRTRNNVDGVRWFVDEVLPVAEARSDRPLRCVIAGSAPDGALRAACASAGVDCIPDPEEMSPLIERARVLINPVRFGSGVNVKMIELLSHGACIVTTATGARGLPAELRGEFDVAGDAESFAAAIGRRLTEPIGVAERRHRRDLARRLFGAHRIREVLVAVAKVDRR